MTESSDSELGIVQRETLERVEINTLRRSHGRRKMHQEPQVKKSNLEFRGKQILSSHKKQLSGGKSSESICCQSGSSYSLLWSLWSSEWSCADEVAGRPLLPVGSKADSLTGNSLALQERGCIPAFQCFSKHLLTQVSRFFPPPYKQKFFLARVTRKCHFVTL